jgi:osmotically-inducible protein OsmY
MRNIMCAALAGVVLMSCVKNEQPSTTAPTLQTQPDRIDKSNNHDSAGPDFNADENAVQLIRRSLSADSSLPTNGKNVKLIVSDGTLTLQGLVKSEREKIAIVAMARQYAGVKHINNQLEVIN